MHCLRKAGAFLLALIVLATVPYIPAKAGNLAYGAATVAATALNIRSAPSTEADILRTVPQNERLVVLEKTSDAWYHVNYQGTAGYVASEFLKDVLKAENFEATGKITGTEVSFRRKPTTDSERILFFDINTEFRVIGINNGWYKGVYQGKTGYVRSDFVEIVGGPFESSSAASAAAVTINDPNVSDLRKQLVEFATSFVGYSYVYGGASPSRGFDCSGLVYYVFHHFGYDVTRTATTQYKNDGAYIEKSQLLPGDLVFFSSNGGYSITHVGIYIGNNQFVHASTPKIGVVITDMDSGYYKTGYYGAKRVLPV